LKCRANLEDRVKAIQPRRIAGRPAIDDKDSSRFDRDAGGATWGWGMRIRAPKDFWAGVMFCGFAAVALLAARGYALGTAGKMGPGYFPLLLGIVLAGLGLLLVGRSLVIDGEPVPRLHLLPIAVIAFAVALFGLMIEPLGLVVTLAVLTIVTAWAGPEFRLLESSVLAVALIAFSIGVFVYLLGLPLALWPSL
jgi:hypothetical protein